MTAVLKDLQNIVGGKNVLTKDVDMKPYTTGFMVGEGKALAVVFPQTLLEQWYVLQCCVRHDVIILMQASNTGITGGSTPDGDDYDRDIVIVKPSHVEQPYLLENGEQVVAFPGTTLMQLEHILGKIGREPHSVIGSSCIGASVIGGVCNNAGGALVKRGPVYTELSVFAQLDKNGELHLVNNMGVDLGKTPEDILTRLENGDFAKENLPITNKKASGSNYQYEVRQIDEPTPARFNSNPDYLHDSSGSAGKMAVFAVRLDTFLAPKQTKMFYIATDNDKDLEEIRRHMLAKFENLPTFAEYLNREAFAASDKYAREVYMVIQLLGETYMPTFLRMKKKLDAICDTIPLLGSGFVDKMIHLLTRPFFALLPKRLATLGAQYEHHLYIDMCDGGIDETEKYLSQFFADNKQGTYIICTDKERKSATTIRFVVANALNRYLALFNNPHYKMLSYDVAYARNDYDTLNDIIPENVQSAILYRNHVSHFFCHVQHQFYICDNSIMSVEEIDENFKKMFKKRGAKYPAEHNVGHKYQAEGHLKQFYQKLDPTNTFNAGVGKMSKNKFYK